MSEEKPDPIRAQAAALDAELRGDPLVAPGEPGPGNQAPSPEAAGLQVLEAEAKEWAGVPYVFGRVICKAMPELESVYTEEACLEWGHAMAPVAIKYGWSAKNFGGLWLPLIGATWKLADPTYDAIKARRAMKPKPAPAPGAPTATPADASASTPENQTVAATRIA